MRRCCDSMALYLKDEDKIIRYSAKYREYTIPVHDGGTSGIVLNFCPWCGTRLPVSRRPSGGEDHARTRRATAKQDTSSPMDT